MADEGTVRISIEAKGLDKLKSDFQQANDAVEKFGKNAGDKMDDSVKKNAKSAIEQLNKIPKEVKTKLAAKAEEAGIKDFDAKLKKLPKEKQVELLTKVQEGKVINFKKELKSVPEKKETTVKAKDEASSSLRHIREETEKTGGGFTHLKEIIAGSMIGGMLQSVFSKAGDAAMGLMSDLSEASAAWSTFEGNMAMTGMGRDEIMSTEKELQKFAQETIYSASDMASTYAQLAAVGTKNTTQLVEGFGGLAAAAEDPTQAMKTLSQQATQMAAKPKVQWEDFKLILEQTPAGVAAVAKSMNMSTTQLIKRVQDGKLATQDFFNAISKTGTNANFSKMATQYKTVGQAMDGLTETLTNRMQPAFNAVSKSAIDDVSKITDYVGKMDFSGVVKYVTAPLDYLGSHMDTIVDIGKNFFELGKIIGGTVFHTAYDVFVDIAKALGLVDDKGKTAKDPLETIDDILKKLIAHKSDIETLTKIWLAFFAVGKIMSWIKTVNDARKAITEMGVATKIFGDGSGGGISLPSLGKKSGTGAVKGAAEDVVENAATSKGFLSKITGFFKGNKGKVVSEGADLMEDVSKGGSMLGKASKYSGAIKGIAGLGAAVTALSSLSTLLGSTKKTIGKNLGGTIGGAGAAWGGGSVGASAGAALGTVAMPGVGTAIGAAIGGGLGSAAGGVAGTSVGKKIGKQIQDGVQKAFHPKLNDGVSKSTDKLKGGIKAYAKSYQTSMDSVKKDMILLGVQSGKSSEKTKADLSKTLSSMSKNVDSYYKNKQAKSKKDLQVLVDQGMMTQDEANKAMAKEKKRDAEGSKSMKTAYANMSKETQTYYNNRSQLLAKSEKAETAAVAKYEKQRAQERAVLVKNGASKAELAKFDQTTAEKVAAKRQKFQEKKDKELLALTKGYQKNMKTLESQADSDTYAAIKINAGKQKDLLEDLAQSKHKLSQKQMTEAIATSAKERDAVVKAATDTYDKTKEAANKKYKDTVAAADKEYYESGTISKAQYDKIVKTAKGERDETVAAAKDQKDKVVKHANDQHNKVVAEATKQAGEHKNAVDTETGEVLGVWGKFKQTFSGVISTVGGWITWLKNLLTGKSSKKPEKNAIGNGGTRESGFATVGEEGFELAHHPALGIFPLGVTGMEDVWLPEGTSILPHERSKQFLKMTGGLPHHADGVAGVIDDIYEKAKKTIGGVGHGIASAFGSVTGLLSKGVSGTLKWIGDKSGLSSLAGKTQDGLSHYVAQKSWENVKVWFTSSFTSLFKKAKEAQADAGGGKGAPSGKGVQRWSGQVKQALAANGLSTSQAMINRVLRQISTESGGNEKAVQGNIGDINNITGDLAKGLMQTISATFNANAFAGHKNIFNGYDNLLAALHYAKNRYGSNLSALGNGHGYANGGKIVAPEILLAGEDGDEYIINPKKNSADELLAAAIEDRAKKEPDGFFGKVLQDYQAAQQQQAQASAAMPSFSWGSGSTGTKTSGNSSNNAGVDMSQIVGGVAGTLEVHNDLVIDGKVLAKQIVKPTSEAVAKLMARQRKGKVV